MKWFKSNKEKIKGYVYSGDDEDGLFVDAKIGDLIIKQNKKPPYIVVDHTLATKIITKWPGKLFHVEVINEKNEKDINKGLVKDVWYTRTFGVKILDEISLESVFGENGKAIKNLIDLTRNIEIEEVELLANYDTESNRPVLNKAWRNWVRMTDKEYEFFDEDYSDTLKMSPKNQVHSSPIREGLSIISSQFDIRARELVGESAFEIDDEGEIFLRPKWRAAVETLLQAGMSYESDNLITNEEKELLQRPMIEVFNTKQSG